MYFTYLGLFRKTKEICRHTFVNSEYYSSAMRVRLPTEFIFPLETLLLAAGCFFQPAPVNGEAFCKAITKGNIVEGLVNLNLKNSFKVTNVFKCSTVAK